MDYDKPRNRNPNSFAAATGVWTQLQADDLIQVKEQSVRKCTLRCTMNRYRRGRLHSQLSIFAIFALLWSQVLLASHPACSMAAMAVAEVAIPAMADPDCHRVATSSESTVCDAHCNQGDQSSEVVRVPPVPGLAPSLAFSVPAIVMLEADRAPRAELPPPVSWHRPTSHPASLLLI